MCEQINDNDDDNDEQDGIGSDKKIRAASYRFRDTDFLEAPNFGFLGPHHHVGTARKRG